MFYMNCCRVLLESTSFAIMGQRLNNRFHLKNAMQKQKQKTNNFSEKQCVLNHKLWLSLLSIQWKLVEKQIQFNFQSYFQFNYPWLMICSVISQYKIN